MRVLPSNCWFNVLRLVVVVPAAIIVYAAAAKLLRIKMLSLVTDGTDA